MSRPEHISDAMFAAWRAPRRGTANPEDLTNPYWQWLAVEGVSAYRANKGFGGPSSVTEGPAWCNERFGQSETVLDDGTRVWVAGEHEDYYDPDFFIYNDVLVGVVGEPPRILGYDPEVFPPTDFHSATRVGDDIVIVGNLGYVGARWHGHTQVRVLHVPTWEMRTPPIPNHSAGPGWIHNHEAELVGDAVVVRRGRVEVGSGQRLVDNLDDWALDVRTWVWTRLTQRDWPTFEVRRGDGVRLNLVQMWSAMMSQELGLSFRPEALPRDAKAFEALRTPPVDHRRLEDGDDDVYLEAVEVQGVKVRYVDQDEVLVLTVEGALPVEVIDAMLQDLREKLARVQGVPCEVQRVER